MLAPRASSAFVCIRCELKLAWPRSSVLSRRPPHARLSTSARRAEADDDASQSQIETLHSRPTAHRLGRIIKRKGKADIRETTARLGELKTLGHDAQILVLREVGDAPEEENNTHDAVPEGSEQAISIIESLQQEKRPISAQEILEQFESLRPKTQADPSEPQYVSQSTYIKLSKTLLRLFNGQQLSHYYSVRKGVKRKNVTKQVIENLKELQKNANSKRPAIRSDWHPGTTQISLRLPGLAVHGKPKQKTVSKHLLVDQILRDLWKLVLLEEIEAPGELELSLRPWQIALFFSGSKSSPLDQIGQARKAKIEIHQTDNVVRITADKNTAEYTADDIENLLQGVNSKRVDLTPWTAYLGSDTATGNLTESFSEAAVRDIATMTGANVQVLSKSKLILRALDQSSVEEAERCIIGMLPLKDDSSTTVDAARRDTAKDATYLFPMSLEKMTLDYQNRNRTLGRWSLPVMRTSTAPDSEDPTPRSRDTFFDAASRMNQIEDVQNQLRTMVETSMAPTTKKENAIGEWDVNPEVSLSADFGLALYDLEEPRTQSDPNSAVTTFLPSVPGLSKMLIDRTFLLKSRPHVPALQYTFVPAPKQENFKEHQRFPRLKVLFRFNERTKEYFLSHVGLRFDERTHDILLPSEAVDIRFHKQTNIRLNKPESNKNVATFIKAVKDNIKSGEKLTAPSLDLDLPEWTLSDYPQPKQPGTRSVEYLFTGVQFRQSVATKFLGADMSFNTVKSGQLGRKVSSLSTYHNTPVLGQEQRLTDLTDAAPLKKFVKRCFAIAGKITQAAGSEKTVMDVLRLKNEVAKPRDPNSARKIRRQALQAVAGNELGEADADRVGASDVASRQTDVPHIGSAFDADHDLLGTGFDHQVFEDVSLAAQAARDDGNGVPDSLVSDHGDVSTESSMQLADGDMDDPYLASILQGESLEAYSDPSTFTPSDDYSAKQEKAEDELLKPAV